MESDLESISASLMQELLQGTPCRSKTPKALKTPISASPISVSLIEILEGLTPKVEATPKRDVDPIIIQEIFPYMRERKGRSDYECLRSSVIVKSIEDTNIGELSQEDKVFGLSLHWIARLKTVNSIQQLLPSQILCLSHPSFLASTHSITIYIYIFIYIYIY